MTDNLPRLTPKQEGWYDYGMTAVKYVSFKVYDDEDGVIQHIRLRAVYTDKSYQETIITAETLPDGVAGLLAGLAISADGYVEGKYFEHEVRA